MSFFRKPTEDSEDDESDNGGAHTSDSESEETADIVDLTTSKSFGYDGLDSEDGVADASADVTESSDIDFWGIPQSVSINFIANTIRKSDRLSISNRLHSIHEDALFVQAVATELKLPLIANERCGSWYVPLQQKAGSCYFKSTDGHFGCWSFSLRRLNLVLIDIIGKNSGCIIVDSTRRGKSIPDALSKTVPIWCAVMNSALFPVREFEVELPENAVSASEATQIRSLLPGFVERLCELQLETDQLATILQKPIKPIWITRDSDLWDVEHMKQDFHPVYLISASQYLQKDLQPRNSGDSGQNFVYIQGAGDDHESWARGLLPVTYWENHTKLLRTPEAELPVLIDSIVRSQGGTMHNGSIDGLSVLGKVQGKLAICDLPTYDALIKNQAPVAGAIICAERGSSLEKYHSSSPGIAIYRTAIPSSKIGSKLLRSKLADITTFGERILLSDSSEPAPLVIVCDTGKDVSVGVALALICHLFDGQGRLIEPKDATALERAQTQIDKTIIRQRLSWITSERTQANPSRATLQAVNTFLMSKSTEVLIT